MLSKYKKIRIKNEGFTLIEALAASSILVFIGINVWIVIDRCVNSTANTTLKMQAFEVARENMEKLLSQNVVTESAEYGISERYPQIQWEKVVENFYEPINAQMWLKAVCISKYYDMEGQEQSVELTHWLTSLTKDQLLQIMMSQDQEQDQMAAQTFDTIEDAATYADVSVETIEQWINNGLMTTDDGFFIKYNLDLFNLYNGNPSAEDKENMQIRSEQDLELLRTKQKMENWQGEIEPKTGLTYGEMEQMNIKEIWDVLKTRQQR